MDSPESPVSVPEQPGKTGAPLPPPTPRRDKETGFDSGLDAVCRLDDDP